MSIEQDAIFVLPSGTELSIEAALGDLHRAEVALISSVHRPVDRCSQDPKLGPYINEIGGEAEACDLGHVAELLELLAAKATLANERTAT